MEDALSRTSCQLLIECLKCLKSSKSRSLSAQNATPSFEKAWWHVILGLLWFDAWKKFQTYHHLKWSCKMVMNLMVPSVTKSPGKTTPSERHNFERKFPYATGLIPTSSWDPITSHIKIWNHRFKQPFKNLAKSYYFTNLPSDTSATTISPT